MIVKKDSGEKHIKYLSVLIDEKFKWEIVLFEASLIHESISISSTPYPSFTEPELRGLLFFSSALAYKYSAAWLLE